MGSNISRKAARTEGMYRNANRAFFVVHPQIFNEQQYSEGRENQNLNQGSLRSGSTSKYKPPPSFRLPEIQSSTDKDTRSHFDLPTTRILVSSVSAPSFAANFISNSQTQIFESSEGFSFEVISHEYRPKFSSHSEAIEF